LTSFGRLLRDLDGHNAYAVLGVRQEAADEEIRKAYREKARSQHPDRTGDSGTRMALLNAAYAMVRDARAEYDSHLAKPRVPPADTASPRRPTRQAPGSSLWDEPQVAEPPTDTTGRPETGPPEDEPSLWDTPDLGGWPAPGQVPTWGYPQYTTTPTWSYPQNTTTPTWYSRGHPYYAHHPYFPFRNDGQPTASRPAGRVPSHLWLALVAALLCAPFGIVGIMYATKVDSLSLRGDLVGARRAARRALWWSLAGLGMMIAVLLVAGLTSRNSG
jgi:Interferon-induced transmembrane protein/DnaJ domain